MKRGRDQVLQQASPLVVSTALLSVGRPQHGSERRAKESTKQPDRALQGDRVGPTQAGPAAGEHGALSETQHSTRSGLRFQSPCRPDRQPASGINHKLSTDPIPTQHTPTERINLPEP
ncbi:unnamed protein product [Arctogadus glacialis]